MSRFSPAVVVSCALACVCAVPVESVADPISVQMVAGGLTIGRLGGQVTLIGDHGFTFEGGVVVPLGAFGPVITCSPCLPGNAISLDATWGGIDLSGTATFEGVTYTQVGSLVPGHASGTITFDGSSIVAPSEGATATLSAPFLFQGAFSFPATDSSAAANASLFGTGTATIVLDRLPQGTLWQYSSAVYQFDTAPVPEPGTMLLVGSALGGIVLRRRRARSAL